MFAASKGVPNAGSAIPPTTEVGGITFWTNGSYSFVVPSGVYQITAVAISGGAGGGGSIGQSGGDGGGGGGGGGLVYSNNISVTPGETLTVVVGAGGAGGPGGVSSRTGGYPGGQSYIRRGASTYLLQVSGGTGGSFGGGGGGFGVVGDVKYTGGSGGAPSSASAAYGGGGGGAAGYSGTGGTGYDANVFTPATAGSGGGGGGSYYSSGTNIRGGGTLFYGEGANGAAGSSTSTYGKMGSSLGGALFFNFGATSGPGGGGAGGKGNNGTGDIGSDGYAGAVRVLWGNSPAFPTTSVSINTISCVSTGASSSSTINIPAGVTTGDTVVLVDQALSSTSTPTLVTPSGFTSITSQSGGTYGRYNVSYKVITNPADAGTTLTGMNGTTNKKIILVFRGSRGYYVNKTNLTVGGFNTTSTPASVTMSQSGMDGYADGIPIVFSMFYGSSGISPGTDTTFSGATYVAGPDNTFYVGYKIYSQSTTSFSDTISMVNRGTNSLLCVKMFGY